MLEACQITLKIKGIERGYAIKCEVFKWALIGLFLFNFFPFKQRYRKNASCVGFQTWIVCVEGEHADHSTNTTTAQHFLYPSTPLLPNKRNLLYSSDVVCGPNRLKFAWRHQVVKSPEVCPFELPKKISQRQSQCDHFRLIFGQLLRKEM